LGQKKEVDYLYNDVEKLDCKMSNALWLRRERMSYETVLTPLEVSEILKISKNTVYELIKRGELNGYKVGKKVRVDMRDVEEYKNRTKSRDTNKRIVIQPVEKGNSAELIVPKPRMVSQEDTQKGTPFIICGQDIMLDILSRYLEAHPAGVQTLRAYIGSHNGLYSLYHDNVSIATAHLWDEETGEYNIPYVKKLLPGIPAIIINLAYRMQGFYVARGNPKGINNWEDLKRSDITIVNREKGSGTRVLLDEVLKSLGISSSSLKGYEKEALSHIAVASVVARGDADLALGNEKNALQVSGVEFIPLQKERYDLVMKKEDLNKPAFQAVLEIINSKEFRMELEGIGGYDLSHMGKVIAET
jgi:putative molybdopterin biosynthesis protein